MKNVIPPEVSGFSWRPMKPSDALALYTLRMECAPIDRSPMPLSGEKLSKQLEKAKNHAGQTICASDRKGNLVAAAWLSFDLEREHEIRAYLAGWVHPDWRRQGLGSFLLRWMEAQAETYLSQLDDQRPKVLRIDVEHENEEAFEIYRKFGYEFWLTEDEMHRSLDTEIPAPSFPQVTKLIPWSRALSPRFHAVYRESFRDRPGFPDWDEPRWRMTYTSPPGFRTDLSFLVVLNGIDVAYAICAEEESDGWIYQLGVHIDYRKQGLGTALLLEAMQRFKKAGLREAVIEVNINNARAQKLYEQLGFRKVLRYTSYRKTL